MKIVTTTEYILMPLTPPNFIKGTEHIPPNGIAEKYFDVADLNDDQLREIGAQWTTALLNHANRRRMARKDTASNDTQ